MTAVEQIAAFYRAAGVTQQQWKDQCDRVQPYGGTMTAAYLTSPDGQVIPGLVIQVNSTGEEQFGVGDLRKRFCGPRARDFCMRPQATENVCVFTDRSGLALSATPLADHKVAPGEPIRTVTDTRWGREPNSASYVETLARSARWTRKLNELAPDPEFTTIKALRERARQLGISPLPRTKREIADLIFSHPDVDRDAEDLWPIEFSYGKLMILRATGTSPTSRVLAHLAEAAAAGRLVFGNASGPWHSGLFLYDGAHDTPELIIAREEIWDWHDARMDELGDRTEQLKAKGVSLYFLGNPRRGGWNDEDDATRYWMNATMSAWRKTRKLAGWWTIAEIDELLADPDAIDWFDDQIADLQSDHDRLTEHGLQVARLEPFDLHRPIGREMRYVLACKRDGEYVIDEGRLTRQQIRDAAGDPEAAIRDSQRRRAERDAQARARRAERSAA